LFSTQASFVATFSVLTIAISTLVRLEHFTTKGPNHSFFSHHCVRHIKILLWHQMTHLFPLVAFVLFMFHQAPFVLTFLAPSYLCTPRYTWLLQKSWPLKINLNFLLKLVRPCYWG
jgi:hypothetical protein